VAPRAFSSTYYHQKKLGSPRVAESLKRKGENIKIVEVEAESL